MRESIGELLLDTSDNSYVGKTVWCSTAIKLTLSLGDGGDASAPLQAAHAFWKEQSEWDRRIRDFAVQKLLKTKNDAWLDDDQYPLTPEQFKSRMTTKSIKLESDGYFSFCFDDGEMFDGHAIVVTGTINDGPAHANLFG